MEFKLFIDNKEIKTNGLYAFEGCHKIYILEDTNDLNEAEKMNYEVFPISTLLETYESACPFKFISNWKLDKRYIEQGESKEIEVKTEVFENENKR